VAVVRAGVGTDDDLGSSVFRAVATGRVIVDSLAAGMG